jgi:hypothetical protein
MSCREHWQIGIVPTDKPIRAAWQTDRQSRYYYWNSISWNVSKARTFTHTFQHTTQYTHLIKGKIWQQQ